MREILQLRIANKNKTKIKENINRFQWKLIKIFQKLIDFRFYLWRNIVFSWFFEIKIQCSKYICNKLNVFKKKKILKKNFKNKIKYFCLFKNDNFVYFQTIILLYIFFVSSLFLPFNTIVISIVLKNSIVKTKK